MSSCKLFDVFLSILNALKTAFIVYGYWSSTASPGSCDRLYITVLHAIALLTSALSLAYETVYIPAAKLISYELTALKVAL